jgi:hypothetical protein
MRRSFARFRGLEASNRSPSLADFIITTSGFRFSVHTPIGKRKPKAAPKCLPIIAWVAEVIRDYGMHERQQAPSDSLAVHNR